MKYYPDRLAMMVAECPTNSVGVEIGVQRGDLSEAVVKYVMPRRYWLVDPWLHVPEGDYTADPANVPQDQQDDIYRCVVERFKGEPSVTILRKSSYEAADDFERGSLDWAYIDGDHTYSAALYDLGVWSSNVKPDGRMFVHDYCVNGRTIKYKIDTHRAVERFLMTSDEWYLAALTEDEWTTAMLKRRL